MKSLASLKRNFVYQHDQTDCGVACLLNVVRYFDGDRSLEKLRELSGTNLTGTTLLGLYQCANQIGLKAEAYKYNLDDLTNLKAPCILHFNINNLHHFVVFYGAYYEKGNKLFIIGDPAKGILLLRHDDILNFWESKTLLFLSKTEHFATIRQQKKIKRLRFWELLKEDANILIATMVLGILITVLGLSMAIFSQKLIDNILPTNNKKLLIVSLSLLFLTLSIRSGLTYIRQHLLLIQSRDFNNRIVANFFGSLIQLPKSFFDRRKTGDMVTRMNDTSRIQRNIAFITGSIFVDIIVLAVTAIFLINYSTIIATSVFCFLAILAFTVFRYAEPIRNKQRDTMAANSMNESNYIDTIQGLPVIKIHNKERFFTSRISDVYNIVQKENLLLGRIANRFNLTTEFLTIIMNIVLITIASFLVMNRQLKTGEMIAIISLVANLIPSVARLSQINIQLQEANIAFDRMYDFMSVKAEYDSNISENIGFDFEDLKLNNVGFNFPGRKPVLNNITFELSKGETIAILGESGSGKSTIMSILQKFYVPSAGSIEVNGNLLAELDTFSWRNIIAVVPQEVKLFNGTLLENISVGEKLNDPRSVIDFCTEMGFNIFFENFPQGYMTLLGEGGINLSGGQKQLIAIARAFYRKPQVLLLDEATSAMDRLTEQFVLQLIQRHKQNIGVIFVTHRLHILKSFCDRIYLLDGGVITGFGTHNQLLQSENIYSLYWNDLFLELTNT